MTYEEARQIIHSSINGLTTSLFTQDRIIFPNHPEPDLTVTPRIPFIKVRLNYTNTVQMALGTDPPTRYYGILDLTYYIGKDSGSKNYTEFIDLIVSNFQTKVISGIVFKVPKPLPTVPGKDWTFKSVNTPFYFDTLT